MALTPFGPRRSKASSKLMSSGLGVAIHNVQNMSYAQAGKVMKKTERQIDGLAYRARLSREAGIGAALAYKNCPKRQRVLGFIFVEKFLEKPWLLFMFCNILAIY